jgi:hypothetical protein
VHRGRVLSAYGWLSVFALLSGMPALVLVCALLCCREEGPVEGSFLLSVSGVFGDEGPLDVVSPVRDTTHRHTHTHTHTHTSRGTAPQTPTAQKPRRRSQLGGYQ